jgi:hypothetical protein
MLVIITATIIIKIQKRINNNNKILLDFFINYVSNSILFRKKKFSDPDWNEPETAYCLDLSAGKLYDRMKRSLLWYKSESWNRICSFSLDRLEDRNWLNIIVDIENEKLTNVNEEHKEYTKPPLRVSIIFVRMGLHFELVENRIKSIERRNLFVSRNQNIDTLIGLDRGLVLCNNDEENKEIIIPSGTVLIKKIDDKEHPQVSIDLQKSLYIPFFIYSIHQQLKVLHSSTPESKYYLSLLHGATSHILPDPFTKLTGTEMAIILLQSGTYF